MRNIGSIVAPLAFGSSINPDAAAVMGEAMFQCGANLAALDVYQGTAERLIEQARTRLLATIHLCESPIEQMMLASMAFMVVEGADCFPPAIHDIMSGEAWPSAAVVIAPQFVIARYRLDFLVSIRTKESRPAMIAVECDGQEFHATTDGRKRDQERDEYLRRIGIPTLRYSGSRIHKQKWNVADDLAAICREVRSVAA